MALRVLNWSWLVDGLPTRERPAVELYLGVLAPAAFPAYSTVGALLAIRRRTRRIGWLLLGFAAVGAIAEAAWQYASRAAEFLPGSLPLGGAASWLAVVLGSTMFPLTVVLFFLLYPDGRLPSPAWRLALGAALLGTALSLADAVLEPAHVVGHGTYVPNPTALPKYENVAEDLETIGQSLEIATLLAGLTALGLRWRDGDAALRRQIRLPGITLTVCAAAGLLAFALALVAPQQPWVTLLPGGLAVAGMSLALPLAIWRALRRSPPPVIPAS